MTATDDQLMTVAELAFYFGVPVKWVYAHSYDLPTLRVGRGLRFRRSEVDAWLESRRDRPSYALR